MNVVYDKSDTWIQVARRGERSLHPSSVSSGPWAAPPKAAEFMARAAHVCSKSHQNAQKRKKRNNKHIARPTVFNMFSSRFFMYPIPSPSAPARRSSCTACRVS